MGPWKQAGDLPGRGAPMPAHMPPYSHIMPTPVAHPPILRMTFLARMATRNIILNAHHPPSWKGVGGQDPASLPSRILP